MTTPLTKLYDESLKTVQKAADEYKKGQKESACKSYKKAIEQYSHYKKELENKFQRCFNRVKEIEEELNCGSSKTDVGQVGFFPTDPCPKLSHVVKLSDTKLNAVGGLEKCKEVLIEAALWPTMYPKFFTGKFLFHHCILTSRFSNLCF